MTAWGPYSLRFALLLAVLVCAGQPAGGDGPERTPPLWSQSILAYWGGQERLFVAQADAARVVALDARTGERIWEREVGARPQRVQVVATARGADLFVSCEGAGEVWVLDALTGSTRRRIPVGPTPRGFDVAGGRYLVTALYTLHQVSVWDLDEDRGRRHVGVHRFPTAVRALDGAGEIWVGHFFDGRLSVLDAGRLAPKLSIPAEPPVNQVAALLAVPGRREVFIPHVLSHDDHPGVHLANAVFPAVSVVDAAAHRYRPERRLGLAFVDRPVNGPEALALVRGGNVLISVNSRSNDLSVIDLETSLALAHVEVGRYPLGIAVDRRETRAFVANAHEHTISVVDLARFQEVARWPYGREVLPPEVARGRDLFHDAGSGRMVLNQWLSCSNCHPGGHADGRVWKLPGKPRLRTKDLHGLADTLPAGWLATQDEMQDEELFIRSFHRGSGLSPVRPNPALGAPNRGLSRDLDALAAYVYWLRFEPSPHLEGGQLSAPARRGRALFQSLGCAGCHPPPFYTVSSLARDTRVAGLLDADGLEPKLPALDVPSLRGLFVQPRLLHDGRAATPAEVLSRFNRSGRHGDTRKLTGQDLQDLETFLLSLPYTR